MGSENDWPRTDPVEVSEAASFVPGIVFAGRYRLEAEIGRGGFGSVWRALDLKAERAVALKMLRPERLGPEARLRFRREAELALRLSHPNTVRVLDHGEDERGMPFIVYELLEGRSLGQVLKEEGALAPERARHIAAQMLKSLMEAHELGIVHRDIKPANVFVCDFAGEPDFVKLLDFGIARGVENAMTALTQTGVVLGTPRYMAPEQLRGDPPTPAMDVYAVGLTLAEMIAGRAVFGGAPMDVCLEVVSARPVPLPQSVTASPLGGVVGRAVEKDAANRHSSAAAMLGDLQVEAPEPVLTLHAAGAPPPAERSTPQLGILALALGAASIIAAFAVVGAIVIYSALGDHSAASVSEPRWIESDAIVERLRERGWQNVSVNKSEKQVQITAQRSERTATILRVNGKNDAAAELLVGIYEKQGYAILRHGKALVGARIQRIGAGTDTAESRTLVDQLK